MQNQYPILFSPPMVRAILDGRKTQTRRKVRGKVCPFGMPGDVLWLREGFYVDPVQKKTHYRADYWPDDQCAHPWKPSIHMPRALSRLRLYVNSIRREPLHDISEADAKAEGAVQMRYDTKRGAYPSDPGSYRMGFVSLWEQVSGPWDDNPEVWVVEFEPLSL